MKINKVIIAFFILIFGSCECDSEPLEEVLGQPCLIDSDNPDGYFLLDQSEVDIINVGICRTGTIEKSKDDIKVCIGQINPQEEQCNNLDDDCDGLIDNSFLVNRSYWDSENTCVGPGVCSYVSQNCINGVYVCDYPDIYGKEKCDGRDNDCDGEIDEDAEDDPIFEPSERYVYTGDPDTINVGECRAGYKECLNGRVNIRNMRTPVQEICGNGDDDDCDGSTDEDETENQSADYLLVVDYSGSMDTIIDSVSRALCEWSTQGVLQNSRFAVIGIGYIYGNGSTILEMSKLTDFTDSNTACQIIRSNNIPLHQGGAEYTLDAIYNSNTETSQFYLSWQNSNRKILIFTDEEMQEFAFASVQDGINMVSQQCLESGYSIGAFINFSTPDYPEWDSLTQNCNGFIDYLSQDSQSMIDTLNYWVGTDC